MAKIFRSTVFTLLRLYVAIEQSTVVRWLRDARADVVIEPLSSPESEVPLVHDLPKIFISSDLRSAYAHEGRTLRRVALNDSGELVYIRKPSKQDRRSMKRQTRRHDGNHSARA